MIEPQNSLLLWKTYHEVFVYNLAGVHLRRAKGLSHHEYAVALVTERAFGNIKLALETDEQEVREQAANTELAIELFEAGACWRGLSEVGLQAESWYDLGVRIAQENRGDWLAWCADNLNPGQYYDVQAGFGFGP